MHAIEELAAFVASHKKGDVSSGAQQMATLLVSDLIAATSAGINSPLATAARQAAVALYGQGPSQVWFSEHRLSIAGAAMSNSAAASALDIDDGHRGAAGHPGAAVLPAVLATAQAIGSDKTATFDAIILGYDVALRVATSRPTGTFPTYSSGLWGAYGVAAGVGYLLGLNAGQIANAMAIAGAESPVSYPTGTSKFQGSSVKEVIPPAVTVGLTAAFRAQAGALGPLDLLDNNERFTRTVLTGDLGKEWWIQQCYIKPYACCRYMHAAVDAILQLREFDKPVVSLRIETFPQGLKLSNQRAPQTLEAGQYSFPFSCALAAIYGEEALQPVDPAMLHDPQVLELASRIELVAHEDFAASFPKGTPCRVILDQGQGQQSLSVLHPLGDVANPMSAPQVLTKLNRISRHNIQQKRRSKVVNALGGLLAEGFEPFFAALSTNESE
jgi:2-methylcitrate dehydratase PrpD